MYKKPFFHRSFFSQKLRGRTSGSPGIANELAASRP
jgi:hypothetical protein